MKRDVVVWVDDLTEEPAAETVMFGLGNVDYAIVERESDPGIAEAIVTTGSAHHDHGELSMYFGGAAAALWQVDG